MSDEQAIMIGGPLDGERRAVLGTGYEQPVVGLPKLRQMFAVAKYAWDFDGRGEWVGRFIGLYAMYGGFRIRKDGSRWPRKRALRAKKRLRHLERVK